ncbi:MAG: DUF2812 domain-containing protein [Terrisporobacter othiniensis]|uniref:DUF2812 domain-containing protein n=1 Tax=Terrisporobacter hibernicus TaxID=2813371 RepID=A0AAX2ZIE6_9FIRM|nr:MULTISPECIES: DUF2812 domain-containing protein [Terrisporobacter]MDU4860698.1 DUF2812 domain-containing protein [Terrisporobacter othiniensis]MDU6994557.1 DUF2812 domain-containing protein [Terrisporobacter othiniensis]UEL48786.1 DUF2812 domain-containing protein [Terrisporobacter hibernicus]SFJ67433.1 SUR7/PalI family protein [Terrisporobacter glycolicus]
MIIYKFFALGEYEKKEKWINIMCSKGYALKSWSFCKYKFEKCNPGEYNYFLELFENLSSSPNQEDFLNYLEDEWSVEYVCHYRNWVFFRRKKMLGKFSMFSNLESKIDYFRRILLFRLFAFIFLICFSILNILYSSIGSTDKVFALLLILIAIIVFTVNIPTFIKYRKLKKTDES